MEAANKGTIRQQIVELLKIKPTDAYALSGAIGVSQRTIEAHLENVVKSTGKLFEIMPAQCKDCEFIFKDRKKITKPTGCPKCNSEVIFPPMFFIKEAVNGKSNDK
jgi:predicted Zn-ribbon and HTH transcriptional regulator